MEKQPTREEAFALLCEYNQQVSLIRHGLAVESVMCHFAGKSGEDTEKWRVIGLCHDLDYEKYPEQHCTMTRQILEEHNWPESYIRAIVSHGWGLCSDVEPMEYLEKVLFATDELTGLITAGALIRPEKKLAAVEASSIRKRFKEKSFAAGANREQIASCSTIGLTLEEFIVLGLEAMKGISGDLGL